MSKKKIGVGILTCNRPDYLQTLLNSLVACDYMIDSFVIVNDGAPVNEVKLTSGIYTILLNFYQRLIHY